MEFPVVADVALFLDSSVDEAVISLEPVSQNQGPWARRMERETQALAGSWVCSSAAPTNCWWCAVPCRAASRSKKSSPHAGCTSWLFPEVLGTGIRS